MSGSGVPVDDAEFLEAFSEQLDRLHNLARGLTRTAQDAEDLLSETWLLALRGWRRQRPDDPAASPATICRNACLSSYRRRRQSRRRGGPNSGCSGSRTSVSTPSALTAVQSLRVRRSWRRSH